MGVEAVGTISQTPTSTITAAGETTLASTTGDVKLDGENNDFQGIINLDAKNAVINSANKLNLGEIKLDSKLKGTGAPVDNIIDSSDILKFIAKDVKNIETDIKNINEVTNKLFINSQKDEVFNNLVVKSILNDTNTSNLGIISLVSTPPESGNIQKVTLEELIEINKNNGRTEDIKISLSENSIVELINGGVTLPQGVNQEFYVLKKDINEEKNKETN